jgi:hypothetical protein
MEGCIRFTFAFVLIAQTACTYSADLPVGLGRIQNRVDDTLGAVYVIEGKPEISIEPGANDLATWWGNKILFANLWTKNSSTGAQEVVLKPLNPIYPIIRFTDKGSEHLGLTITAELPFDDGTVWVYSSYVIRAFQTSSDLNSLLFTPTPTTIITLDFTIRSWVDFVDDNGTITDATALANSVSFDGATGFDTATNTNLGAAWRN